MKLILSNIFKLVFIGVVFGFAVVIKCVLVLTGFGKCQKKWTVYEQVIQARCDENI